MALTKDQVLSDAGDLATQTVAELSAKGMTPKDNRLAVEDARKIYYLAAEILGKMLEGNVKHTIH